MNKQILYPKSLAVRGLSRREPTDDARGFRMVPDGEEEFFYETSIDLDGLCSLAERAARNKTGKAKDGALFVKVLSRRRLEGGAR